MPVAGWSGAPIPVAPGMRRRAAVAAPIPGAQARAGPTWRGRALMGAAVTGHPEVEKRWRRAPMVAAVAGQNPEVGKRPSRAPAGATTRGMRLEGWNPGTRAGYPTGGTRCCRRLPASRQRPMVVVAPG
jgi:hypothetical protein